VPLPELRGTPGPGYPWTFAGHRLVPGLTAERADLTEEERSEAAAPLGRFLKVLHSLPADQLEGDRIGRLDAARLRKEIRGRLPQAPGFIDDPVRDPREEVLVHGDLHARQLLIEAGHLRGVLDWGDAHRGDRAVDLAIAHSFLPRKAHTAFRAAYGPIDAETWKLARLRAVHVSAALLTYAKDVSDVRLAREAEGALGRIEAS
jgi:aminoglycoside phosphotransferase (APT) family kinase protein